MGVVLTPDVLSPLTPGCFSRARPRLPRSSPSPSAEPRGSSLSLGSSIAKTEILCRRHLGVRWRDSQKPAVGVIGWGRGRAEHVRGAGRTRPPSRGREDHTGFLKTRAPLVLRSSLTWYFCSAKCRRSPQTKCYAVLIPSPKAGPLGKPPFVEGTSTSTPKANHNATVQAEGIGSASLCGQEIHDFQR